MKTAVGSKWSSVFIWFSPSEFLLPQQYDERQIRFRTFPLGFFMKPPFLLSKSLELVRIEQDPVRVFVSVQFDRRFEFQEPSQLFIRVHNKNAFRRRDARQQSRLFALRNQRLKRSRSSIQLC